MRASSIVCAGLLLTGSVFLTGCPSADTKSPGTPTPAMTSGTNGTVTTAPSTEPTTSAAALPTTVNVTVPNSVTPEVVVPATTAPTTVPTTAPVVAAPAAPPFMPTHVLTKDEPYYKELPAAATAPSDGTLKAGTKILVFVPSVPYCKVGLEDGTSVYVATEGIDPINNK
jgi:hypothetical protein